MSPYSENLSTTRPPLIEGKLTHVVLQKYEGRTPEALEFEAAIQE
ncbi:MAG: hypothetical protein ACK5RC_14185 [Curvibacter sp.]|jgi:hypothetical protein